DKVEKGDPVVELETDKVNVEVNSDYSGVIAEILFEEGDDVSVGETIAKVDENAEAGEVSSAPEPAKEEVKEEAKEEPVKEQQPAAAETESTNSQEVIATPAARKLARELNIDLSQVKPQDPLGRVRPEDVEAASRAQQAAPAPVAKQPA